MLHFQRIKLIRKDFAVICSYINHVVNMVEPDVRAKHDKCSPFKLNGSGHVLRVISNTVIAVQHNVHR